MTRIMGDSTTLADIPTWVDVVAVNRNGTFAVTEAQVEARFPHARYGRARIDVNGSAPAAQVRDWETGDKAGSLEQWVTDHNRLAGKKDAVVYCNRSTIPEVRRLTGSQILGHDYFLWVATLDGTEFTPAMLPGVIACQRDGQAQTGGHWDRSIIYDGSFWLPAAPPPPAKVTLAQALAAMNVLDRYLAGQ
jgi:hypothetical protein